jgi:ABC-2 type transport system permease protein
VLTMKYAWLVAWREYAENAKTKGFWIGLFLMPTILFLSAQVPIWLEQKATPTRYFVLVDQSGELAPLIEKKLEESYQQKVFGALKDYARKNASPAPGTATEKSSGTEAGMRTLPRTLEEFIAQGGEQKFLERLRPRLRPGAPEFEAPRRAFAGAALPAGIDPNAPLAAVAEQLKPYVRGEQQVHVQGRPAPLSAALLIPRDLNTLIVRPARHGPASQPSAQSPASQIEYWSANASEFSLREEIERIVNDEIRRREYLARGLDSAAIREVEQTYLPFASLNPKKEKGQEKISTVDTVKQWAPSGFVYLLWLSIFVIIQMLLNNTIEEKSNRIIEVLLSSVTPGELMMGKLVGIAAIGLTMVGAWMCALFAVLSLKSGGASQIAGQLLVVLKGSSIVPLFSVYFLLGYIMYAAFILSVGSVCNTIKEAQNYMGVLTMIMMVPLLTMTFIPKDPNGSLARVLSWIPLYTPFTMMNRATADPPLIDLIGTLVLLIASAAGALWMSGKIFRIGILRTGQPPKVVEMVRWALKHE